MSNELESFLCGTCDKMSKGSKCLHCVDHCMNSLDEQIRDAAEKYATRDREYDDITGCEIDAYETGARKFYERGQEENEQLAKSMHFWMEETFKWNGADQEHRAELQRLREVSDMKDAIINGMRRVIASARMQQSKHPGLESALRDYDKCPLPPASPVQPARKDGET